MSETFEKQKNIRAWGITLGIAGVLLLLMFLWKWPLLNMIDIPQDEYIEINLGSSDFGSGIDQPELPGEPAQGEQLAYNPPIPSAAVEDNARDVETDDNDRESPAIIKPSVTKPNATKINAENKTVKTTTTQPVVVNTPPKPKAVLGRTTGGNGNGGNGAETYKPGTGEGIAGGPGDQGRPGGVVGGKDYTGTPKNFGVKVLNLPAQSFEDEFNENAKVAMDVVADERGKVISATYQPRGSTTSNRSMVDIARRKAFELKLGSSDAGQKGTVVFNFKLKS